MTLNEKIQNGILSSTTYRDGRNITSTSVRGMFNDSLAGVHSAVISRAIAGLCDQGYLIRNSNSVCSIALKGGKWLKTSWRTNTNRELFGDEYDAIMGVAR